jgi:nucleoside-diphosphate-sugar epimerase
MRLLVLGGTRFVGRAIVEEALRRGHEVTTFNRGQTGVDLAGVEAVHGDRESSDDLHRLVAGRSWDLVVDTSGYVPRVVGDASRALVGRTERYVFLSTISVYPDWPAKGISEASPVYEGSPDVGGSAADEASWSATQYGTYKAGCERAVVEIFGDRALVLRPGVILGPHENVGRLTWWLGRMARGGRVLGPGNPDRSIQPIDVRDVARFALDLAESGQAGAFNVAAPKEHATFGSMLAHCAHATNSDGGLVWVDDEFLVEQGVRQWTEIPLWRVHEGTWDVDTTMARAAGLTCRPLAETVRDTWAWMGEGGGPAPYDRQAQHGPSPERERQLLALWEARADQGRS